MQEAERFAAEDKAKREAVDTKNQADSMVYQTRKQLTEFKDKLPADVSSKVEAKVKDLEEAIKTDDTGKIKAAMDTLQQEVMAMGQAMYSQAGAAGQPEAGAAPGGAAPGGKKGGDDGELARILPAFRGRKALC